MLWKRNVLDTIKKISSKSYQEKTWFGSNNLISSPVELFCELFDDFLFEKFLESDSVGLTSKQKKLGIQFKNKLDEFSNQIEEIPSPYEVFNDQKWIEIRNLGNIFLESFVASNHLYQLGDTIKVKKDAPKQFHPDGIASICGVFQIVTEDESQKLGYPLNTVLYTVEFHDGTFIDVPESLIEIK